MALSDEKIILRFGAVNTSIESIESASAWVLQHRDSVGRLISCWLEAFKSASEDDQIALIYLANDVCQKSKRTTVNCNNILQIFPSYLVTAIAFSKNNEAVQKAITRVLNIFEARETYSKEQIAEMRAAQNDAADVKSLVNIDARSFVDALEDYIYGQRVMECARRALLRSDFNYKDKIHLRMRDRDEGLKFVTEVQSMGDQIIELIDTLVRHRNKAKTLMEMLLTVCCYFKIQYKDATLVFEAYMKFASCVINVRTEAEEMIKNKIYPGASPPLDAPSPTANDDPFRSGVELAYERMRRVPESTEVTDMDVEREDERIFEDLLQWYANETYDGSREALLEAVRLCYQNQNQRNCLQFRRRVVSDPRLCAGGQQSSSQASLTSSADQNPLEVLANIIKGLQADYKVLQEPPSATAKMDASKVESMRRAFREIFSHVSAQVPSHRQNVTSTNAQICKEQNSSALLGRKLESTANSHSVSQPSSSSQVLHGFPTPPSLYVENQSVGFGNQTSSVFPPSVQQSQPIRFVNQASPVFPKTTQHSQPIQFSSKTSSVFPQSAHQSQPIPFGNHTSSVFPHPAQHSQHTQSVNQTSVFPPLAQLIRPTQLVNQASVAFPQLAQNSQPVQSGNQASSVFPKTVQHSQSNQFGNRNFPAFPQSVQHCQPTQCENQTSPGFLQSVQHSQPTRFGNQTSSVYPNPAQHSQPIETGNQATPVFPQPRHHVAPADLSWRCFNNTDSWIPKSSLASQSDLVSSQLSAIDSFNSSAAVIGSSPYSSTLKAVNLQSRSAGASSVSFHRADVLVAPGAPPLHIQRPSQTDSVSVSPFNGINSNHATVQERGRSMMESQNAPSVNPAAVVCRDPRLESRSSEQFLNQTVSSGHPPMQGANHMVGLCEPSANVQGANYGNVGNGCVLPLQGTSHSNVSNSCISPMQDVNHGTIGNQAFLSTIDRRQYRGHTYNQGRLSEYGNRNRFDPYQDRQRRFSRGGRSYRHSHESR